MGLGGKRSHSTLVSAWIWLPVLLFLAQPTSQAQGPSLGGQAGDSMGNAVPEPRGSAVTTGDSGSATTGRSQVGGLTGGRAGHGGGFGSQERSRLSESPGGPDRLRLGPALGASGVAGFESAPGNQGQILGGRMGMGGNRVPIGNFQPQGGEPQPRQRQRLQRTRMEVKPPDADPISLSSQPRLEIPREPEVVGPPDGLTLDDAIGLLLRQNLNLIALRHEIPKAEADVLTAGLRSNPIFYADGQLIPYGRPTPDRPAGGNGQPQYDVNITQPLDISRKRRARIEVACQAKKVTEAQLQDAVRSLIDQLYMAYVNVLAARETLRYSDAYAQGMARLFAESERRWQQARSEVAGDKDREKAQAARDAMDDLRDQVQQGKFQTRRAEMALNRARRELALILNVPEGQAEFLRVRGRLRELVSLPVTITAEALIRQALEIRPDLIAYRLGVHRAEADIRLARANRFSDIYLVYQPYTFQDNSLYGVKSTHAWALGVNAALPIFNRNQGNIERAKVNFRQTEIELSALERQVAHEVGETFRAFQLTQSEVLELEREVLPASTRARDLAFGQYRQDPAKVNEFIDKQKDYNDVVQQYRNALIEHRQDMLELNTAVGIRLLP